MYIFYYTLLCLKFIYLYLYNLFCFILFSNFGREAEYIVGLYLKSKDWNVYFSKGSRGPSDIVAMKDQLIWLIQIKSGTSKNT